MQFIGADEARRIQADRDELTDLRQRNATLVRERNWWHGIAEGQRQTLENLPSEVARPARKITALRRDLHQAQIQLSAALHAATRRPIPAGPATRASAPGPEDTQPIITIARLGSGAWGASGQHPKRGTAGAA
jgi:hypothetical protein